MSLGVEVGLEVQGGGVLGGVAAQHLERANAHRAGLVDPHRPPDPARVPVGIDAVPVLEDAGQVAFGGEVGRAGAGHLDRQQVVGAGRQRGGHLEGVGKEIPLGVAEVLAVQPDVALVEDAVEGQEPAPAGAGAAGVENRRR